MTRIKWECTACGHRCRITSDKEWLMFPGCQFMGGFKIDKTLITRFVRIDEVKQ